MEEAILHFQLLSLVFWKIGKAESTLLIVMIGPNKKFYPANHNFGWLGGPES